MKEDRSHRGSRGFLASLAIAALTPFLHSAALVVLGILLAVYQGALLWWSRRGADEA